MTSEERKKHPVFLGFLKYFPDAAMAVSNHSWKANEKHNPGESVHWDRSKSTDEMDALCRHIVDKAKGEDFCADGLRTSTSIAWRALANLQKELEAEKKQEYLTHEVVWGNDSPVEHDDQCTKFCTGKCDCWVSKE